MIERRLVEMTVAFDAHQALYAGWPGATTCRYSWVASGCGTRVGWSKVKDRRWYEREARRFDRRYRTARRGTKDLTPIVVPSFPGLRGSRTGAGIHSSPGGAYESPEALDIPSRTYAPKVATKGFAGDFDVQCQQDGTCLGPAFNARNYISSFDSLQFLTFSATFASGPCGVWRQSIDGHTGDIVC